MNTICLTFYDEELRFIIIIVIWELIRKAIALYQAGKRKEKVRFMLIFIFNTCGILPIAYLLLNQKKNKKN